MFFSCHTYSSSQERRVMNPYRVQGIPGKQRLREGPLGAADWAWRRLSGNPRSGFVRQAPACPAVLHTIEWETISTDIKRQELP